MHPLRSDAPVIAYFDFKSPYAYLAKDPTWRLEAEFGIQVDFRPLTLNIPSYLGSAKVDDRGAVVENNRTPRQWQGVRYAYHDAKRYARARGMTLYGPKKIWDSSCAAIGMLWVRPHRAVLKRYMDLVYERFWKRELDIECPQVIADVITEAGGDGVGFRAWQADEGQRRHDELQAQLHPAGLFGVPSYVVGGEVFFGREHGGSGRSVGGRWRTRIRRIRRKRLVE